MSLRNVRGSARNEPASNIGMWSPNSAKLYKKINATLNCLKSCIFALLAINLNQGKLKLLILVSCFLCWSIVLIGCAVRPHSWAPTNSWAVSVLMTSRDRINTHPQPLSPHRSFPVVAAHCRQGLAQLSSTFLKVNAHFILPYHICIYPGDTCLDIWPDLTADAAPPCWVANAS